MTSWNKVGKWYDEIVGEQGQYHHQTLIIPNVLRLFDFSSSEQNSLVDFACGQGVLSRHLPEKVHYVGIDIAQDLIKAAKKYSKDKNHLFLVSDITKPLPKELQKEKFTHACLILALQNIENPLAVFKNITSLLEPNGKCVIVLNHPCFRIPRQSSWKVDIDNKTQYRRIDRYMSPMKIPIQAHPSQGRKSETTWSFHHPLSDYSKWLKEAGFQVELIEEWCSKKESEGKYAKMENRSRTEIPLFMAIVASKK